jgi:hypothetical protein
MGRTTSQSPATTSLHLTESERDFLNYLGKGSMQSGLHEAISLARRMEKLDLYAPYPYGRSSTTAASLDFSKEEEAPSQIKPGARIQGLLQSWLGKPKE